MLIYLWIILIFPIKKKIMFINDCISNMYLSLPYVILFYRIITGAWRHLQECVTVDLPKTGVLLHLGMTLQLMPWIWYFETFSFLYVNIKLKGCRKFFLCSILNLLYYYKLKFENGNYNRFSVFFLTAAWKLLWYW